MYFLKTLTNLFILILLMQSVAAQNKPISVEAESGELGSDFKITTEIDIECVTISTDLINSGNPGDENRVATYSISFPAAGTYDVYMRLTTGPGTYDDDSFFLGKGFGKKNATSNADWQMVNGLASGGYTFYNAVVDGKGDQSSEIWKWINISELLGNATFTVPEDQLVQVLQIGAREDGLYFDKIVFGKSDLYFTIKNLSNGEEGSVNYPDTEPKGTPMAAGLEKFLGSAWDYNQAYGFASYWNQVTPGNAGKWGSVEGTRDVMNWDVMDSTYNVAQQHNMLFREHTLFWGAQQPSWIGNLNPDEQLEEIIEWLVALADRYPKIDMIDVVNEPIHNGPNGIIPWGSNTPNVDYSEALGGAGESGYEWILGAFRLAREYFPNAALVLNDYNIINSEKNTNEIIKIINLLQEEELIDGFGEQAHAFTTRDASSALLKKNLDAIAATGVDLYITEMDIDGQTDLVQLEEMQRVFPIFWEHPAVKGITFWGYRFGVWRQEQGAYLINEDGTERPAFLWLKAYVQDTLKAVESIEIVSQTGVMEIDDVGDQLQLSAKVFPSNATIQGVSWKSNPSSIASINDNGLLTAKKKGTVTITAEAWDGSGLSVSQEITIKNDTWVNAPFNINNIKVYPNPTVDGRFTMEGIEEVETIQILTNQGKIIEQLIVNDQPSIQHQISQAHGIYILKFIAKDYTNHKLIIR